MEGPATADQLKDLVDECFVYTEEKEDGGGAGWGEELSKDITHSPFGLVCDVLGPPVSIYGHPAFEACFPFIICQHYS